MTPESMKLIEAAVQKNMRPEALHAVLDRFADRWCPLDDEKLAHVFVDDVGQLAAGLTDAVLDTIFGTLAELATTEVWEQIGREAKEPETAKREVTN